VDQDLLAWQKEQTQLSKLRALAKQLFDIPESSAASEQSFKMYSVNEVTCNVVRERQ